MKVSLKINKKNSFDHLKEWEKLTNTQTDFPIEKVATIGKLINYPLKRNVRVLFSNDYSGGALIVKPNKEGDVPSIVFRPSLVKKLDTRSLGGLMLLTAKRAEKGENPEDIRTLIQFQEQEEVRGFPVFSIYHTLENATARKEVLKDGWKFESYFDAILVKRLFSKKNQTYFDLLSAAIESGNIGIIKNAKINDKNIKTLLINAFNIAENENISNAKKTIEIVNLLLKYIKKQQEQQQDNQQNQDNQKEQKEQSNQENQDNQQEQNNQQQDQDNQESQEENQDKEDNQDNQKEQKEQDNQEEQNNKEEQNNNQEKSQEANDDDFIKKLNESSSNIFIEEVVNCENSIIDQNKSYKSLFVNDAREMRDMLCVDLKGNSENKFSIRLENSSVISVETTPECFAEFEKDENAHEIAEFVSGKIIRVRKNLKHVLHGTNSGELDDLSLCNYPLSSKPNIWKEDLSYKMKKGKYKVALLVDVSGSMIGFYGKVASMTCGISTGLRYQGINTDCFAFSTDLYILSSPLAIYRTDVIRFHSTQLSTSVLTVKDFLDEKYGVDPKANDRFFFVITDGQPTASTYDKTIKNSMKETGEEITKLKGFSSCENTALLSSRLAMRKMANSGWTSFGIGYGPGIIPKAIETIFNRNFIIMPSLIPELIAETISNVVTTRIYQNAQEIIENTNENNIKV